MTTSDFQEKEQLSKSIKRDEQYRWYWTNTNIVPRENENKHQLPNLISILKSYCDINKIESILEVGVGYGRVAKEILDNFPNIQIYIGLDMNKDVNKSSEYVGYPDYVPAEMDFEKDSRLHRLFDMVISVETMSVVPHDVTSWIAKMISYSKKYVVNLDYATAPDSFSKVPPHPYYDHYFNDLRNKLMNCNIWEFPNGQQLYIAYVR